jgi:cysteine desulfurase/selenocysteine lyase
VSTGLDTDTRGAVDGAATADLSATREEFPVLRREFGGRPVVYLDSAATSLTPEPVVDAMDAYYRSYRASVHRGVYPLAVEATDAFEGARERIARWLGSTVEETIFTGNVTASINLVAYTWGRQNVGSGDLIVLTEAEHHSNVVPWQMLAADVGAELAYVRIDDEGRLDERSLGELLTRGPKLVALGHISNVLGTINPVAEITARAHEAGAVVVIDGAQAVSQIPVDLREIDADFYAWTGHKLYGPTGIGVLHGRRELLEEMPPFMGGGHMIRTVGETESTWTDLPWKFEGGTSQIAEAIGLGAAVDWVEAIGITLHGPAQAEDRGALVSFVLDGAHPHDVGEILGREGVCVRTGHHCAQPLMRRLGATATTRASYSVFSTTADTDRLIDGLAEVRRVLQL